MPVSQAAQTSMARGAGQWTVNGSVEDFRALQARLRETGQRGMRRNMNRAIVAGTAGARQAVKQTLAEVMPRGGGLNDYLAKSKITTAVLTGATRSGVEIRGRGPKDRGRSQGQFRQLNQGKIRRPVYADASKSHKDWHWVDQTAGIPAGWWEDTLTPFGAAVELALVSAMNVTAREAGFTR